MSQIKINDKQVVEGKFSFGVELDESSKPAKVVISGAFQTTEYVEEITKLESRRFIIDNIKVKHEGFGSEEENIIYSFIAGSFSVKPGEKKT